MNNTVVPNEEKSTGMLAHLLGLLGFLGPLIVFLVVDEKQKPFSKKQAKEALNFQLFIIMCHIISSLLWVVAIGLLTTPIIAIYGLVFTIIATVKANNGEDYKYPITIRFIPENTPAPQQQQPTQQQPPQQQPTENQPKTEDQNKQQ